MALKVIFHSATVKEVFVSSKIRPNRHFSERLKEKDKWKERVKETKSTFCTQQEEGGDFLESGKRRILGLKEFFLAASDVRFHQTVSL